VSDHWSDRLALVLVLAAVIAGALTSLRVFQAIPHIEDEFANLWQADVIAEGRLDVPSPTQPKSFLVPFVVDYQGRRFGKYPPGWPALLSLGARADLTWLVNPLLGGLALWLTYQLAKRWLPPKVALVAPGLLLLSPMVWMLSGTLMSHNLGLALTAGLTLVWVDSFCLPAGSSHPWLAATAGGAGLGLLALTRPLTAVGVGLPLAAHGLVLFVRRPRTRVRLLVIGGLAVTLAGLLPLWQYALTGDPWLNPYTLWWPYDRVGFGPGHGVTSAGHSLWQAYINTRFSLQAGLHDAFGWPYFSWLFLPLGAAPMLRRKGGWLVLATLPSLVLVYGAYWIGSWLFGPRYYYEALPTLAVLSAAGVGWLGGWLPRLSRGRVVRLAVVGFVATLVVVDLGFYLPRRVGGMRGLYGIDAGPLRSLRASGIDDAVIFVLSEQWTGYANLLPLAPPFSDSDTHVAWSIGLDADRQAASQFPAATVYYYDAERPGILLRVQR
jgi:4-amino-4-deoxy-L-arabinose transferase-like glycosyltransferase